MKVRIKKLNKEAVIPKKSHVDDAGFDLTAVSIEEKNDVMVCGFGLAFEIPKGYVGLIFPRSSIAWTDMSLTNSVCVIDSGYTGEVKALFRHIPSIGKSIKYKSGERVAQMIIIPYPNIEFEVVNKLKDSKRGNKGFGSTGK